MRRIFLVMFLLLSIVGASFGQVKNISFASSSQEEIRARLDHTVGLLDFTNPAAVAENVARMSKGGSPGPGDRTIALLHASKEFVRRGEIVEYSLFPTINSSDSYQISGMVLKPGYTGEYDGSERVGYFDADTSDYGIVNGLRVGQQVKVHSRMFNSEDSMGKLQISFIIVNLTTGELVQQIWVQTYLVDAGIFPRPYSVDEVRPRPDGLGLFALGKFPVGIPIYYMIGVPRYGFAITGPNPGDAAYATPNGRRINFLSRIIFNKTTSLDLMMWSPYTRQAIVAPNVRVEVGAQQP